MLQFQLTLGQNLALRSALLINGGAAVAFLAFIGTIWSSSSDNPDAVLILTGPLMIFVFGVFFGAVACGAAYLAQVFYAETGDNKVGNIIRIVTVILVIGAYACFGLGAYQAKETFNTPIVKIEKHTEKEKKQEQLEGE